MSWIIFVDGEKGDVLKDAIKMAEGKEVKIYELRQEYEIKSNERKVSISVNKRNKTRNRQNAQEFKEEDRIMHRIKTAEILIGLFSSGLVLMAGWMLMRILGVIK